MKSRWMILIAGLVLAHVTAAMAQQSGSVTTMRTPNGGIQPQAAVDAAGVIHLIYFKGDERRGDVFYVKSIDGESFSEPIRVNSNPGSAVAIGAIRGAHLAVGRAGRVHVAWNGSSFAEPKAPGNDVPMLYTRLNDSGEAFEPQRNLIAAHPGLDGGGSLAADREGHVYVVWQAPEERNGDEASRVVWITRSEDDGKTFSRELAVSQHTGACECCAMRAQVDQAGNVYILYRSATDKVYRDMYLLFSTDVGKSFRSIKLHAWKIGQCVMSSASMLTTAAGVQAAWETNEQVFMSPLNSVMITPPAPVGMPGDGENRKHPTVTMNTRGETLIAWTEGTGWNKTGSVAWRVFDATGRPIGESNGKAAGLPVWSLVTSFTKPDGSFVIVY